MSFNVGNAIQRADLINVFNLVVVTAIKANAYDRTNPPMESSYQCVPSSMMDDINNLPTPSVGVVNGKISAATLANALISTTQNLTRVGTFTYVRTLHESHTVKSQYDQNKNQGYTYGKVIYDRVVTQATKSGKVVFTNDYARQLGIINHSIVSGTAITISGINALCQACLNAWNATSKYNYAWTNATCHSDCHNNCHTSCHSSCHGSCYSD